MNSKMNNKINIFKDKSELMNHIKEFKIITSYRTESSISGYRWDVVKSALQKYIRRGNVDMALKMTMEMYCFSFVKDGKRIMTNGLHRLQIIFLEDIGCGNLNLWNKMIDWFDILYRERKKNEEDRNRELEISTLTRIVVNLCRSRKIRCSSFMNSICVLNNDDLRLIPNFRFKDIMTDQEKHESLDVKIQNLDNLLKVKSWRSILYLRDIIYIISSQKSKVRKQIKSLDNMLDKYFKFMSNAIHWKRDIFHLKEGYILYFTQLCQYLYGSDELQLSSISDVKGWPVSWIGKVDLDDFVYDKHVSASRFKSIDYFVNVSSMVYPSAIDVKLPLEFKQLYVWIRTNRVSELRFKKTITFPIRESELKLISRAQLITSRVRTDTYYATYAGYLWFIKGPFLSSDPIKNYQEIQNIKRARDLNAIDIYHVRMIVDRWPERPGIGLRHKFEIDDVGDFMVCKSLVSINDLKIITHPGSKMWKSTNVIDLKRFSVNVFSLNTAQLIDYINNLGFRLEYNLSDLSDRNFILIGDIIYSIDEEITSKPINLMNELRKRKFNYLRSKFIELTERIDTTKRIDKRYIKLLTSAFKIDN